MKPWMKKLRNWFGLCQEEDERHINFLGICLDNLFYKKKKKWETNGEETWKQKDIIACHTPMSSYLLSHLLLFHYTYSFKSYLPSSFFFSSFLFTSIILFFFFLFTCYIGMILCLESILIYMLFFI